MTLIDELFDIEREAYKKSPIHSLDARVKIILCICGLLAAVILPYNLNGSIIPWSMLFALIIVYMLFACLYVLSKASLRFYLIRLCVIMPFGLFFIILQPFFFNQYYDGYHILATLPLGVNVYLESLIFGVFLLLKFVISLSFIILLSATTTMQKMTEGAARLHVPKIFITTLSLTVRYIFYFGLIFKKIESSFASRGFIGTGKGMPLKYRLTVIGNAAGSLFVRAINQGEHTYTSMCCRGYSPESEMFNSKKPLESFDAIFLITGLFWLAVFPVVIYLIF